MLFTHRRKPDLNRRACIRAQVSPLFAAAVVAFASAGAYASTCGGEGERPCTVGERIPSCDLNLVESGPRCVRPPCGRAGERLCGPTERVFFDFIVKAPVPQPCDANLKPDFLRGVCIGLPCGAEGQRACTIFERIPSCDVNLVEAAGTCVRPACGRLNERLCAPSVRNASAMFLGMCDANLVPGPGEVCIRPGVTYAGAAPAPGQTYAASPVGGAATPPPPAGSVAPPPSSSALPPPPPGRIGMLPAPKSAQPPLPASGSAPGAAAAVAGLWRINGNGHPGDMQLQQAADGALTGSIYGEPVFGWAAEGERTVAFLRGPSGQPIQFYAAQFTPDGALLDGQFHALTVAGGAGPARNVFGFRGQRQAVPANQPPSANAGGPADIGGSYTINGNGYVGALALAKAPDGSLAGTVYADRLAGHYAAGTGTLAFVRYSGATPIQVFVGRSDGGELRGDFYALTAPAGASAQRVRFGWSAQRSGQAATPLSAPRNLR